jgi:hypothetical protein
MGISRACASTWVNRHRLHGDFGLLDRPSTPTPARTDIGLTVARVERVRREHRWSAVRIAFEPQADGTAVSRRTVTHHLHQLGLTHRRFIDPAGGTNRAGRTITARGPGHMVYLDTKKARRIAEGGG